MTDAWTDGQATRIAVGSAWATTPTTLTVGMVRVVSPIGVVICPAGYWNDEASSATTVGTVQPVTAMTVTEMGRPFGNARGSLATQGNSNG
jgi:hypothetical protein